MLARAHSRLGPKLRAHARPRSYLLGARDFGTQPIPNRIISFYILIIELTYIIELISLSISLE